MDVIDSKYKKMIDKTIGLYEEEVAVFDAKPLIKQYFTEVIVSRNAMQLAISQQAGGSTIGSTADLNTQKKLVSTLGFSVVQKVRPYAKTKTNAYLEKVDFSISDFMAIPQEEFAAKVRNFAADVRTELAKLALYEVTEAELALIETGADTYEALSTGRDLVGNSREQATENIPKYRRAAVEKLNLLNDLVPAQLGQTHPDLVARYLKARELEG